MGSCCSSVKTSAMSSPTSKIIARDGTLMQFFSPVTVCYALCYTGRPQSSFICNANMISVDDPIPAMDPDDVLQLGELYFVLPTDMLHHSVRSREMATLALKAIRALRNCTPPIFGESRSNRGSCNGSKKLSAIIEEELGGSEES